MVGKAKHIEIGLLIYPESLVSATQGLTDLFSIAGRIANDLNSKKQIALRVSHWQQLNDSAKITRVFDSHPHLGAAEPTVIIVPPRMRTPITSDEVHHVTKWLRKRHEAGTILCSVCSGAFLLAEAGVLNNRVATTHWTYAPQFANQYPEIKMAADQIVVDDGDIMTAGGLMAWTDLGLTLVDRFLGPTVMSQTARFMVLDPPGREQRFYGSFSPVLNHGDASILKVQHWLQGQIGRTITIPMMAKHAKLAERTFLRRFHKASGFKPTEYFQQVKLIKAREMLELSNKNVDEIAWTIGYEDPGAFRKLFKRIVGLTPGEYRTRFSPKAAPARE